MSTPAATISVWVGEQSACIRIVGRATFTASADFKALINELLQRGCRCIALDLSECVLMDSTFLGVLAGFGLKLSSGNGEEGRHGIELLGASPRILELLDTLGVLHLFKIVQGPVNLPSEGQPVERTPGNHTKEDLSRTCQEAHEILMGINPENAARFKDVAQFLAQSLKKSQPE